MSISKRFYWMKLKSDFFNQKYIRKLRKVDGGDTLIIIFMKMQLLSLKNEGCIAFESIEKDLSEQLAFELEEDQNDLEKLIKFLEENKIMEELPGDVFMIPNVIENIGSEADSTARVKKHRDKKKAEALQCNTEIDIELEIKRKEKEEYYVPSDVNMRKFTPPTLEEVKKYVVDNNKNIDPVYFWEYYESIGWVNFANKPIVSWKAAVGKWKEYN